MDLKTISTLTLFWELQKLGIQSLKCKKKHHLIENEKTGFQVTKFVKYESL